MPLTHVPAGLYLDYSGCHVLRKAFADWSVQSRDQNEERVRKQERLRGQGDEDDLRAFLSERKLPYPAEPQKAAPKQEELESWILGMENVLTTTAAKNTVSCLIKQGASHCWYL